MKKIIGALGIFALAWLASYVQQHDVARKAWAGVTCTLPVILQNGTTADATQVMQDLNQLAGCFTNVATVSQVICGPGLDGGTITGTGTCSLSAARRTNPTVQALLGGSGTYTTPTNALWLEVQMVGGGGGGAGNTPASGNNGGDTTFSTATAGGGAGAPSAAGDRGAGGTKSGCTFGINGSAGVAGITSAAGGPGGTSFFGGAGAGGHSGVGGAGAANSGSGGGGDNSAGLGFGGGGAGGYCFVIINNPAATYSFVVGASGAGGSGGGGAGGAGAVYVIEHYN